MKTSKGTSDELQKDISTLRLDINNLESLTVKQARNAYHKIALEIHPDKADPENAEQVAEFTAAFKELGNSYQRVLKFIVERLQAQSGDTIDPVNDEAIFAKENFHQFNFPFENNGSFTVNVEDNLAEAWQDCLESVYGEPRIFKNPNGTECDRLWKIMFGQNGRNIEITIHFYNHNKPKDKKQSKILIQGAVQSLICEYVFCELPKIYKMVSERKVSNLPQLRHSKRKRVMTPVKKRNMKYKTATKTDALNCALCDFVSVSRVKVIKHMKSNHTEPSLGDREATACSFSSLNDIDPKHKLLVEDMSIVSDDEEELLTEKSHVKNVTSYFRQKKNWKSIVMNVILVRQVVHCMKMSQLLLQLLNHFLCINVVYAHLQQQPLGN